MDIKFDLFNMMLFTHLFSSRLVAAMVLWGKFRVRHLFLISLPFCRDVLFRFHTWRCNVKWLLKCPRLKLVHFGVAQVNMLKLCECGTRTKSRGRTFPCSFHIWHYVSSVKCEMNMEMYIILRKCTAMNHGVAGTLTRGGSKQDDQTLCLHVTSALWGLLRRPFMWVAQNRFLQQKVSNIMYLWSCECIYAASAVW